MLNSTTLLNAQHAWLMNLPLCGLANLQLKADRLHQLNTVAARAALHRASATSAAE